MDAKRRIAGIRFLVACLAVALLLSLASGAWALPDTSSLRRTVPTRTPTREQPTATRVAEEPTPTKKPKKDNPTPAPTATAAAAVTPDGPTVTPGGPTDPAAVTPAGDVTPTSTLAASAVTHYSETGGDYAPLFAIGGILFVLLASGAVVMWLRYPGATSDR